MDLKNIIKELFVNKQTDFNKKVRLYFSKDQQGRLKIRSENSYYQYIKDNVTDKS